MRDSLQRSAPLPRRPRARSLPVIGYGAGRPFGKEGDPGLIECARQAAGEAELGGTSVVLGPSGAGLSSLAG